jgi:hypothetical protein
LAARTHSYAATSRDAASNERRSNPRATLAVVCGLVAVVAIPLAIEVTRKKTGAVLLDAAWAIPVAAIAAVAALILEHGARRVANRTLGQAGSAKRRNGAARVLAVTGICLVLSSSLAVGVYEFLVWKETH